MDNLKIKDIVNDVCKSTKKYNVFSNYQYQIAVLFIALSNTFKESSWKTENYFNGDDVLEGCFLAGIDTPDGTFVHLFNSKYWNAFKCNSIDFARKDIIYLDEYIEKHLTAEEEEEE